MERIKVWALRVILKSIRYIETVLSKLKEAILNTADLGPEEKELILNKNIEDFFGPESLRNKRSTILSSLKLMGIDNVRDLVKTSRASLIKDGGVGTKTFQRIEDMLASCGLSIEKP